MQIHAETLFLHDDAGRLRSVNTTLRPEEHPAPLVYFGRTVAGTVCRFRHDVPVALCEVLEEVGRRESFAPLEEDAGLVEEVRRRLEDAGWVIGSVYSGPAYVFAEEIELRKLKVWTGCWWARRMKEY
jgi:hypothetical protein